MDKKKVKELIEDATCKLNYFDEEQDNYEGLRMDIVETLEQVVKELSKSDWISVKDRLPEYNERVLVRYKYGKETYTIISYRMKDERIRKYNNGFIHPIDGFPITHWKPIEKLEE